MYVGVTTYSPAIALEAGETHFILGIFWVSIFAKQSIFDLSLTVEQLTLELANVSSSYTLYLQNIKICRIE